LWQLASLSSSALLSSTLSPFSTCAVILYCTRLSTRLYM
jgi:hypothetical protein